MDDPVDLDDQEILGPRGSKFTEERRRLFMSALADGRSPTAACSRAGISMRTLRNWKERALDEERADRQEYADFFSDCAVEQLKLHDIIEGTIVEAAKNDPRIAIRYLETFNPEWWIKKRAPQQSGGISVTADEVTVILIPGTSPDIADYFGLEDPV